MYREREREDIYIYIYIYTPERAALRVQLRAGGAVEVGLLSQGSRV